ncbi:coproporphyrinogen iii oxidase [Lentinula edodes]|uniref:coproporphyrinogen oxidase n=1 Tax=Lentinula edodes TaxID=5353 RepID=A0A1Q3E316_LENED|nr:coproporphyrinogen iii oxidase [Lentinula edodes]
MSSSLESSSSPSNSKSMRGKMESWIRSLQEDIVQALEKLDPNAPKFQRDSWVRPEGGMGQSCVFAAPTASEGQKEFILEKAGVNISIVHGTLPPPAIKQMRADHTSMPLPEDAPGGLPFFAAGISLVIHPKNPHAPTCHANYRYFEITDPESAAASADVAPKTLAWWFGGGSDLTPSYLYPADATHFHQTHKYACDAFSPSFYPALKKWCDEYFYIPHRSESRGIGGIFFDDLHAGPHARLPDNPSDHPRTLDSIFVLVSRRSFLCTYEAPIEAEPDDPLDNFNDTFSPYLLFDRRKKWHTTFTMRIYRYLLRFARNKDPHSLEVSPHLLPSAGSLLKFTGQICWSNFFHYHLLSGIPAILTHTFSIITVVASPLKLAPRPLAPNVVVLSLGWDETTAFLHGEQRPALFFYNNYGLTAGRDPHGGIYIYPLQRSPKGLQNLGPDNTQLIAYFRDEEQFRSTMATLRDLRALGTTFMLC